MLNWFKLNPKIRLQAIVLAVAVLGDVVNQVTNTYPHATWLPLVVGAVTLAVGYLKSAE